jgi:hypothetical protein
MTLQLTFLVADQAMKTLDEIKKTQSTLSRKEICMEVLTRTRNILDTSAAGKAFWSAFIQARTLVAYWKKSFGRMVSEDVRPVLGSSARQKMADLGRATGEPYSSERKAQLIELWDQNLEDLHIAIPHEASFKAKWLDNFMKLQTGQLYFMQVLSQLESDKYQAELLRRFRPEWAKDDSRMNNKGDREKAIMRCA